MKTPCIACGTTLGQPAIDLADRTWRDRVAALRAERPFVKFRLARRIFAICPVCGARYTCEAGKLERESDEDRGYARSC